MCYLLASAHRNGDLSIGCSRFPSSYHSINSISIGPNSNNPNTTLHIPSTLPRASRSSRTKANICLAYIILSTLRARADHAPCGKILVHVYPGLSYIAPAHTSLLLRQTARCCEKAMQMGGCMRGRRQKALLPAVPLRTEEVRWILCSVKTRVQLISRLRNACARRSWHRDVKWIRERHLVSSENNVMCSCWFPSDSSMFSGQ
jgi:hypothetical protein